MNEDSSVYGHAAYAVQMLGGFFMMQHRNIHAIGVGRKIRGGKETDEICVRFFVARKVPAESLPPHALLPAELDTGRGIPIPTDVVEGGPFYEEENSARIRPARPGTSLGSTNATGTFGAIVIDTHGAQMILSNNHILADNNTYPIGGVIIQQGEADGGHAPADTIATLERFAPKFPDRTNYVDAAIARPTRADLISGPPLNGVPAPSPAQRAVALHIGGGNGAKWGCPIVTALEALGVTLPHGGSTVPPELGMAIQKTGATTERTSGTIGTVSATVTIGAYTYNDLIGYDETMTAPGDSGSVIVENR